MDRSSSSRWSPATLVPLLGLVPDRARLYRYNGAVAAAIFRIIALRMFVVDGAVRLAFEFLVLTAARSSEVRLAWDEIDTAGAVWRVLPRGCRRSATIGSRSAAGRWRASTRRGRSAKATGSCSRCGAGDR